MKKLRIFQKSTKLLVTGGLGFIGSEFVRQAAGHGYRIIVVDKISYAGDPERLKAVKAKYKFYKTDICDKPKIDLIFKKEDPEIVVNFAAETHVDRSIRDASAFVKTNINGTKVLLDASRKYKTRKFIHISTDEVYGEIRRGRFTENSPLKPNSPYAASKAAADLLIGSYIRTYGFPAAIVRPCNNYGPWQYPEKFIPVVVHSALKHKRVPVYAKGLNRREWLHVSDCARAILLLLRKAKTGQIYNVGSGHEEKNINIAKKILAILSEPYSLIEFVKDRPGHDYRYSLNSSKIRRLGWRPQVSFESGIRKTIKWNEQNLEWLQEKFAKGGK